jgi:excisionase family DNA binding protein
MAESTSEQPLMTVADVAEHLQLNQQTIRNWIDAGTLPAVRVGRRVRIRRSDLDQLLDAGYRGNSDPTGEGSIAENFWGGEPVGDAEFEVGADE